MRFLKHLIVGLTILAATIGALTTVQFIVFGRLMSSLWILVLPFAPILTIGLNIAWFGLFLGMIIYGGVRSKPGVAFAPLIFAAIWMTTSIAQRWWLSASLDPQVSSRSINQDARANRTLIMRGFDSVDRKIIADGHIDHLIKVWRDDQNKITSIEDVSIAQSDSCSAQEKNETRLYRLDRSDVCFRSLNLAEIPDGMVVEYVDQSRLRTVTETRLRTQGKERQLFSWVRAVSSVLSYFPTFQLTPLQTRIWEAGTGVTQEVRYGVEGNSPAGMVSAIFGVTPSYQRDFGGALAVVPPLNATETLDFAETFARNADVSLKSVAALLAAARDKGLMDGRSISIAASLIGHDNAGWNAATDFAKGLTNEQTEQLVDQMLKRLETPNICGGCVISRHPSHPALHGWKLREKLLNPEPIQDRAIKILVHGRDLARWQYEGALKIMAALGPQYPDYDSYFERSLLPLILLDDTLSYSDKAIAYLHTKPRRIDSQGIRLAAKLDLVRDSDLKDYIVGIWSSDLKWLPLRGERPEKYEFAAKACKRISRIEDPAVRSQDFPVDCTFPSK